MANLFSSSIGKKLIMSVTGLFLILFLTFHMCMNLVAVFSGEAYNAVCAFLGTNWYALAGTMVLAVGFVFHLIYAFCLSFMNRKARSEVRYLGQKTPAGVEWASQNMLVLGLIVIVGLGLHMYMFWAKMMFAELAGSGAFEGIEPTDGAGFINYWFKQPVVVVVYLVWLVALWFHLTHGFWSAFQTIGWNNKVWLERLKCIANVFATIICAGFALVVIAAFVK